MANKGCNRCKHHKSSLNDDLGMVYSCLNGKQREHNLWWQNNGHKTDDLDEVPYGGSDEVRYEDVKDILTCYPPTNIK